MIRLLVFIGSFVIGRATDWMSAPPFVGNTNYECWTMIRIDKIDWMLLDAIRAFQEKRANEQALENAFRTWIASRRETSKSGEQVLRSFSNVDLDRGSDRLSFAELVDKLSANAPRQIFSRLLRELGTHSVSPVRDSVWKNCGTTPSEDTFGGGRYQYFNPPVVSGEAEIWKAIDLKSQSSLSPSESRERFRVVALKRPSVRDLSGPMAKEAEERLRKEAKRAALLEHPNICPVYDIFEGNDTQPPFYTMRFLAGKTLQEVIRDFHNTNAIEQRSRQEWQSLIEYLIGAAAGVSYAHKKGFVHLDLKPANISIGDQNEAQVIDWGMASRLHSSATQNSSTLHSADSATTIVVNSCYGTPAYAAPEQSLGEGCGIHTDIFQLGAILFECLTGATPFGDSSIHVCLLRSALNVRESIIEDARYSHLRKHQLLSLGRICEKAMATRPVDRYPDVESMRKDLIGWRDDLQISVNQETVVTILARTFRKNRNSIMAAVAINLAIVGLSALVIRELRSSITNANNQKNQAVIGAKEARESEALAKAEAEKQRASRIKENQANYRKSFELAKTAFSKRRFDEAAFRLSETQTAAEIAGQELGPAFHLLRNRLPVSEKIEVIRVEGNPHQSDVVLLKTLMSGDILSLSADGVLAVWDGHTRGLLRRTELQIRANEQTVDDVIDEEASQLLTEKRKQTFLPGSPIAISKDETIIAIGLEQNGFQPVIQSFSIQSGERLLRVPLVEDSAKQIGRKLELYSLDFSRTAEHLVVGLNDSSLLISHPGGEILAGLTTSRSPNPVSLAFDGTGTRIMVLDGGFGVGFWDVGDEIFSENRAAIRRGITDRGVSDRNVFSEQIAILISPKNDQFLSFGSRGLFQYPFDLSQEFTDLDISNSIVHTLSSDEVAACCYSNDGLLIAAMTNDELTIFNSLSGSYLVPPTQLPISGAKAICLADGNRSLWLTDGSEIYACETATTFSRSNEKIELLSPYPSVPHLKSQSANDSALYGYTSFPNSISLVWKWSQDFGQQPLLGGDSVPVLQQVQISPDRANFAIASARMSGTNVLISIYRATDGQLLKEHELPLPGQSTRLEWTTDSSGVLVYSNSRPVDRLNFELTLADLYIPTTYILSLTENGPPKTLPSVSVLVNRYLHDQRTGGMIGIGREAILGFDKSLQSAAVLTPLSIPTNKTLQSSDYSSVSGLMANTYKYDFDSNSLDFEIFNTVTKKVERQIKINGLLDGNLPGYVRFDSTGTKTAIVLNDREIVIVDGLTGKEEKRQGIPVASSGANMLTSLVSDDEPGAWYLSLAQPVRQVPDREKPGQIFHIKAEVESVPKIIADDLPNPFIASGSTIKHRMVVGNGVAGPISRLDRDSDGVWRRSKLVSAREWSPPPASAIVDMAISEEAKVAVLARENGSLELFDFPSFRPRWIKENIFETQDRGTSILLPKIAFSTRRDLLIVGAPNRDKNRIDFRCFDVAKGDATGNVLSFDISGWDWSMSQFGSYASFHGQNGVIQLYDRKNENTKEVVMDGRDGASTVSVVDEISGYVAFNELRRVVENNSLMGYRELIHLFKLEPLQWKRTLLVRERMLVEPIRVDEEFLAKNRNFDDPLNKIAISPDGQTVAARKLNGGVFYLWDLRNMESNTPLPASLVLAQVSGKYNPWSSFGFSPSGEKLYEGMNGEIEVFDFRATGK